MFAILEDRYSGAYSYGKWLIIDNYYYELTEKEIEWLNKHISEVDKFYLDREVDWAKKCAEKGIEFSFKHRDNILTTQNTRLDAVEKTFQNSDCYAAWNFELMPWCIPTNDISSTLEEIDLFDRRGPY